MKINYNSEVSHLVNLIGVMNCHRGQTPPGNSINLIIPRRPLASLEGLSCPLEGFSNTNIVLPHRPSGPTGNCPGA